MRTLIPRKSVSEGVQKEHFRIIPTSKGLVPMVINKGVRPVVKIHKPRMQGISVRPLKNVPGVSVSLKPLDRRSELEKKIQEFMKEKNIKLESDETLIYEPMEVRKVGKAQWDLLFYFINEKGKMDWVSLHRPHMYTVKFHILDALNYGREPFIVLRNADNEIAGIRSVDDDEVVSF